VGKAHLVLPHLAGLTWQDLLVKLSEVDRKDLTAIHSA
jgi:hypothetical protein